MAGTSNPRRPGIALQMHELVAQLDELRRLTILDDQNPQSFRARAYDRAVRRLRDSNEDLAALPEAELLRRDGIGKAIAAKMREFFDTGRIAKLETLRERFPPAVQQLAQVPGVGPKTLARLRAELGIEDVEALRAAVEQGALRNVTGLGHKSEQMLRRGVQRVGAAGKDRRQPIARVLPEAELLVAELAGLPGVAAASYCGSLRRLRSTIADLDILVAASDPRPVMAHAAALPVIDAARPAHGGDTRAALTTRRGLHVDLRVVAPDQYGAAALYFTGSQAHNIRLRGLAAARGWLLNEYGLWNKRRELIAADTEEAIYAALGLPLIAPTLREDRGEIEAAQRGELPAPVTVADLRGDLHLHTDASGDGRSTLGEMVAAAARRDFSYLAITDHGEDSMNGVNRERLLAQRAALRTLDAAHPRLRLLHGVELNIGPNGSLDYDAAFRASFDWCVAAVHSAFDLDRAAQTRRIIAAMEDPSVNVIGHLCGRMIGRRPGIELDIDAILAAAARTGTAIEVNSSLSRLDAAADVLRRARALPVTIVVNSDAHHQREFDRLHWGALHAQRGWVDRERIANTWPTERFLAWAAHARSAAPA
ncbi:MAG: helix-hairpin-helix domain-containing protein [Spirochaetaceae bacterium]|nr:helix-hairpin-helix domain-containing protein [Spirochaetaceae bacterium]